MSSRKRWSQSTLPWALDMNPPTFTGFSFLLSTTPVPSPGFRQLQKMPVLQSLAHGGYGVCFNASKHQQPSLYICWAPGGLSLQLTAHFGLTYICWPCSERSSTCSLSGWQQQGVQGEVGGSQGVPCPGTETPYSYCPTREGWPQCLRSPGGNRNALRSHKFLQSAFLFTLCF